MPDLHLPEVTGWRWDKTTRQGDVIDVICKTARETDAGLVVMSTDGRNGFLDALRGSHSERVLRECPCALLAIPAGGFVATVLGTELKKSDGP